VDSAPVRDVRLDRAVRLVAAVVVAASAAYFWGTNVADEDLWNHITFGTIELRTLSALRVDQWSYSAPGHPFFNHEWGTEVVFALLYRLGGTGALLALKAAVGVALLGAMLDAGRTLARTTTGDRARPDPALTAAVLVLVFATLAPGASFRAQLFTMLFLALELALLVRAEARLFDAPRGSQVGWELAVMPLLMLVWTNLHGGFVVGVAVLGLFVVSVLARSLAARAWSEPRPGTRALALLALSGVAALAATAVNPYGTALHRYLATTLDDHGRIVEWLPIPAFSTSHAPFKLLTALTLACAVPWITTRPRSARLDWRLAFVVVAAGAAFRHQRHSVLAAIAAAPLLLVSAEALRRRIVARRPALVPRAPVAIAIAAGALAVAGIQLVQVVARYAESPLAIRYERDEFPADAIAFLDAEQVRGNMAVQFEWGGYTLYHLGDRARVFIDGRYEAAYPPAVIDDYFAFVEAEPAWARVLDAYPTEVVLIDRTATVVPRLDARPDFVRVYADPTAVVYLRRTPANGAAIARATALAARAPATTGPTFFP
jgi:hypothetical protein